MKSTDIRIGETYETRNNDGRVRVTSPAKTRGWWNTERADGRPAGVRHSRNLLAPKASNDAKAAQ